jgi:hypothetical protein
MTDVGKQKIAIEAINAIFEAIPKSRRLEYLGDLNEVLLYIQYHPEMK